MNIGIFGDSYADINPIQHRRKDLNRLPWALWLEDLFNATVTCHAASSTGLWYSFDKFRKNYKKYNKIVFVYTEYGRWNGLEDEYVGIANIRELDQTRWIEDEELAEVAKKLANVHSILYNQDLNLWIYQQIFNEVNSICNLNNIDIVNILPFERYRIPIDISQMKGPVLYNVQEISAKENEQSPKLYEYLMSNNDIRFCHMNAYNNKVLADLIHKNIHQRDLIFNLGKYQGFKYEESLLEYEFSEWEKIEK